MALDGRMQRQQVLLGNTGARHVMHHDDVIRTSGNGTQRVEHTMHSLLAAIDPLPALERYAMRVEPAVVAIQTEHQVGLRKSLG